MPNWNEVLQEMNDSKRIDAFDFVRRKYLLMLQKYTKRNVIAYYSGWLQKPGLLNTRINDDDKNGLMASIHKLDRSKGLDILLHTSGGEIAATESIVNYLRKMFGTNIRAIIPQIAMSAGTMMACACKEIIMGKESNIGPIDPQFNGIPAQGVIDEFETALKEIQLNPKTIPIWQVVVQKYHPSFIGECKKSIAWSHKLAIEWLKTGMFEGDPDAERKANEITTWLESHDESLSHARHYHIEDAMNHGLKIIPLENEDKLQDLVLTIHHCFMHTLANTPTFKIIENHLGNAVILIHREVKK